MRRCLAAAVAVAVLWSVIAIAVPHPALAAETPLPDAEGNRLRCNVAVSNTAARPATADEDYSLWLACQGDPSHSSVAPFVIATQTYADSSTNPNQTMIAGWDGGGPTSCPAVSGHPGQFRCGPLARTAPYVVAPFAPALWPAAAGMSCYSGAGGTPAGQHPCKILEWTTGATGPPAMPTDWYPGGSPEPSIVSRPAYTCERQYNPTTGTVDLDATGPTGLPAGALSGAVISENWSVPWLNDGAPTVPKVATLTAPTTAPPGGWTLTFSASVELTSPLYQFTPAVASALAYYMPYLRHEKLWWFGGAGANTNSSDYVWQHSGAQLPDDRYVGTEDYRKDLRFAVDGIPGGQTPDLNGLVRVYWPRLSGEPERDDYIVIGPAASFVLGDPQDEPAYELTARIDVAGGYYETTTATTVTLSCQVLLDVTRPALGGAGTTDIEDNPPPAGGTGAGGCSAGPLGSIPLIGGILDATASLACAIGDIIGRLLSGLLAFFMPPANLDWGGLWEGIETEFPFSIGTEIVSAVAGIHAAVITGKDGGDACGTMDVRSIGRAGTPAEFDAQWDGFLVALPTPEVSGCPGWGGAPRTELQNRLGDMLGFRQTVRGIAAVFLYLGVFMMVLRAFTREDPDEVAPV